nr:MAG TPA: hypothetical protein [Caudoviricetes sp.]
MKFIGFFCLIDFKKLSCFRFVQYIFPVTQN